MHILRAKDYHVKLRRIQKVLGGYGAGRILGGGCRNLHKKWAKGKYISARTKILWEQIIYENFFQIKILNSPSAHVCHSHKRRWYIYITYRSHSSHKIQDVRICLDLCLYILTQQRKLYTWGISWMLDADMNLLKCGLNWILRHN